MPTVESFWLFWLIELYSFVFFILPYTILVPYKDTLSTLLYTIGPTRENVYATPTTTPHPKILGYNIGLLLRHVSYMRLSLL